LKWFSPPTKDRHGLKDVITALSLTAETRSKFPADGVAVTHNAHELGAHRLAAGLAGANFFNRKRSTNKS
jgi:hypothetical protein